MSEKTCPVRAASYTSWEPVTLDLFSFAVMPGIDDVAILVNPTLKALGIDIYDRLGKCACNRATLFVKGLRRPISRIDVECAYLLRFWSTVKYKRNLVMTPLSALLLRVQICS